MKRIAALCMTAAVFVTADTAVAQDANMLYPVSVIEQRIRDESLDVLTIRGSRAVTDRTQSVVLGYPDSSVMRVKWGKAAYRGSDFNNEPRYEVAVYELQKLFLDEAEYIVPPTVIRAVSTEWLKQYDQTASPTFGGTNSTVLVIQYWLLGVTNENFYDEARLETDTAYARHLANLNILTYLIRHSDSNRGNFLVSESANGRVFAVDNGVAFRSDASDRGFYWRSLRIKRLPAATIERLRLITRDDLDHALGVVGHFEKRGGYLVRAEPNGNLDRGRGVRSTDEAVQFGLTSGEIGDVFSRLQRLLGQVDDGEFELF